MLKLKKVNIGQGIIWYVIEVLITDSELLADAVYIGRRGYVHLESNTILIEHKENDFHMTHNVDDVPMIPLFASDFKYRVLED